MPSSNNIEGPIPIRLERTERKGPVLDRATLGGLAVGIGGIYAGLHLEGCRLVDILQPTAALIVFGGTIGAVLVQFPRAVVVRALRQLRQVLLEEEDRFSNLEEDLLRFAKEARRRGVLALDEQLGEVDDPLIRKALALAIDGAKPETIRSLVVPEIERERQNEELNIHVFESAAGFAPTIGVLGAILNLMRVMQSLGDMNLVGKGIALSFVATIYGIASANLVFLPFGGKLRLRSEETQRMREIAVEAIIEISQGITACSLEFNLRGFGGAAGTAHVREAGWR